jgi:hypothetical protein
MNTFFAGRISRLLTVITVSFVLVLACPNLFSKEGSLAEAVNTVKQMVKAGKSKGEIAGWITRAVDQRIVSLNLDIADEKRGLNEAEYRLNKEVFDAWSHQGVGVDEPYASAHWTWNNRVGHCQENAHMAYHMLMMALESGENIRELACGDHIYVVWGVPGDFHGQVTIADLNRWDNAYIIDPWQGLCKAGKDVGRTDWTLTKGGFKDIYQSTTWAFETYRRKYEKWRQTCEDFSGNWGRLGDRLLVTQVGGNSNIRLGQFVEIRPAGVFQVSREQDCTLRLKFRASEIEGRGSGTIASLNRVIKGSITAVHLALVTIHGQPKLKVVIVSANPNTGVTITREGLLSK